MEGKVQNQQQLASEDIERYREEGFRVVDNIVSPEICDKIVTYIDICQSAGSDVTPELDRDFPYSDLEGAKLFRKNIDQTTGDNSFGLIDYRQINQLACEFSGVLMRPWLKKVYLKNAFQGDCEVYHQDFEYHREKTSGDLNPLSDYIQCFLALTDHILEGGCLNIIKKSHLGGRIPHKSILTRNGLSKLTIDPDILASLSSPDRFVHLELSKGSCVFFSYLTVHGSASNASPIDQPRMVIQFMKADRDHSSEKSAIVQSARRDFEINTINKILGSLKE
jgi:ectoine hydroxylase